MKKRFVKTKGKIKNNMGIFIKQNSTFWAHTSYKTGNGMFV
jgi:hypothetical protein